MRGFTLTSLYLFPKTEACLSVLAFTAVLLAAPVGQNIPITIEGEVVCVDTGGAAHPAESGCDAGRYALRTDAGKLYFFLPTDSRAQILTDPRVRQRRLRISGQLRPGQAIEIVKLQSVKDGKVYDLYYRCETCNITAYVGGPCPCCQQEMEFRETPAQ